MSVLVITNKWDITSDVVIEKLYLLRQKVFRFNTEDICSEVDTEVLFNQHNFTGSLKSKQHHVLFEDIQSVYYRRPEQAQPKDCEEETRKFISRECAIFCNWLWLALADRFWVSKPSALRLADSKLDQLRIAPKLGFNIPKTLITNKPSAVRDFYKSCGGKIVNKVLACGFIERRDGNYCIYTRPVGKTELALLENIQEVPCVFQEQIPKQYEVRVTVVGTKVFATAIYSQVTERTRNDWRRYDLKNTPHRVHQLPSNVESSCLALVEYYGLAFGAIDLIVTPEDKYVFLEINPNGQWYWLEEKTGQPISTEIAQLLAFANAKK